MKRVFLLPLLAAAVGAAWWATGYEAAAPAPVVGVAAVDDAPSDGAETPLSPGGAPGLPSAKDAPKSRTQAAAQRPAVHPLRTPCDFDLSVARIDDADDPLGVPPRPGLAPMFDPSAVCRLSGRVVAPEGGAQVALATGLDAGRRVELDADGWFELGDLHPGRVLVRVEAAGGRVAERMMLLGASGSKPEELIVDFTRAGTAALRLLDHKGAPMPDTDLRLDGRVARTDATGRVRLAKAPLGEAWCEIVHGDWARRGQGVPVSADGDECADVALLPGAQIELQLDAQCNPRDLLQVAVVPVFGRSGPGQDIVDTPWWTYQPLAIPAGEKAWFRQLPAGRYSLVPFVNGALQRGKSVQVDVSPGRMRTAHIDLGSPECQMVRAPNCDAGAMIVWRTANRLQKCADDYEVDSLNFGYLGIPASPGIGGVAHADSRGAFCLPRSLFDFGAQWSWSTCGSGFASAPQMLVPAMPDYRESVEAQPGPLVVELPPECAGHELRVCMEGAARPPQPVGADASIDLGELHGLWRLTLRGKTLQKPATIVVSANGGTQVSFRKQPPGR